MQIALRRKSVVLGVVFLASRLEDGPLVGPAFYAREPCVGTDAPYGAPFNFHVRFNPNIASNPTIMAYGSATTTITLGSESDFLVDSGVFFIDTLRKIAQDGGAPEGIRNDWRVLEEWLSCSGRQLGPEDHEKIGLAWRAYFAVGVAPSKKLQPVFDTLHRQYKTDGRNYAKDKPSSKVMDVFDRLLATDAEIKQKKKEDWDDERKRFEPLLKSLSGSKNAGWWRSKSKLFRLWAFGSIVWAAVVFLFVAIFDPFNHGSWSYMREREFLQMLSVMVAPLLAGGLKYIYDKFVK